MASKKKWKKRALAAELQAHELFNQSVARAEELARIDILLMEAEFPGPTMDAWVAQTQQFLQKLVDERKLTKKSSTVDPIVTQTGPSTSVQNSSSSRTTEPDGEYEFLEPAEVSPGRMIKDIPQA